MIATFVTRLQSQGWKHVPAPGNAAPWIPARYGSLPGELREFLESFALFQNGAETIWFLAADDYRLDDGEGFAWNEFERMTLEAAQGDPEWSQEIRQFWDSHLPVFMSVDGYYSYVAYCRTGENCGCYVWGSEPEFEEVDVIATDLAGLLTWAGSQVSR